MDNFLGLLKVKIVRGINLAVRDVRTSDPYVVVKMGKQKLKTSVMYKCTNPEWNEELTFSVTDPDLPLMITVYDKDTFTHDDKMGEAELEVKPFIEAVKMHLSDLPSGTIITSITPSRQNCLAEESDVVWQNGDYLQKVCLRLKNVECGELELELQWVDIPGTRGI